MLREPFSSGVSRNNDLKCFKHLRVLALPCKQSQVTFYSLNKKKKTHQNLSHNINILKCLKTRPSAVGVESKVMTQ